MKAYKLLGNKKTPSAMLRVLMFGRYFHLAAEVPNKVIILLFASPVNTSLRSYAQYWTKFHLSPIRCKLQGLIAPEYHKSKSIVAVVRGLTPRTGRQSKRNLLDMGPPITALFTMQERAVEPFKINFTHTLSTGF